MEKSQINKLQRVVIKEELLALIETYYKKQGVHMRAAFLNNLIFWQGIRMEEAQKEMKKIERAAKSGVKKEKIEKMLQTHRGTWFWKTSEDLAIELMGFCSASSITRMNKEFEKQGWIVTGNNPDPKKKWDKSTFYKVNLAKINEDLNELGYFLEGFKITEETPSDNEPSQTPEPGIFHGENSNTPPFSEVHESGENYGESPERSIFHGENSIFHGESSIFHGERAIPEGIQQKVTTEGKNLNLNQVDVNELKLPMEVKRYIYHQNLYGYGYGPAITDSLHPLEIEKFYNTNVYVNPQALKYDPNFINDFEFAVIVKAIVENGPRPIHNSIGILNSYTLNALSFKKDSREYVDIVNGEEQEEGEE